jgi:hypothetical protein
MDPHRVQAAVTQESRYRGQIDRFDESPCGIVSEPVRMNMGDFCTTTEHDQ